MSQLGDNLTALAAEIATQLDTDANTASLQDAAIAGLTAKVVDLTAQIAALEDKYEPQPMPLLAGLSQANSVKAPAVFPGAIGLCNVYWADLQTTAFGPLVHPNAIDTALATGRPFRVRLFFGQHSPAFAATIAGTIKMTDKQDGVTALIPNWFNLELQAAQADVIQKLADAYDGKISAIFMGTNADIYAEPFMRHTNDLATRAALLAAPGYSQAADQQTYYTAMDMFSVFKRTRLGLSFNPHQYVKPDGTAGTDTAFTLKVEDDFRARFPSGIVQNNSIGSPPVTSYLPMYAHQDGDKPLSYQTQTAPRIGDLAATIQWAIDQGAHLVEMNAGWGLTADQLSNFDAALKANV
jgi:hypothetical protein